MDPRANGKTATDIPETMEGVREFLKEVSAALARINEEFQVHLDWSEPFRLDHGALKLMRSMGLERFGSRPSLLPRPSQKLVCNHTLAIVQFIAADIVDQLSGLDPHLDAALVRVDP
jgi:hypothetical protein